MVVNSINFWIFFIIVLVVYYGFFRKSSRWQNITLFISSYIFYGMVDWKMCALLLGATGIFYALGLAIDKYNNEKPSISSRITTVGVCLGFGLLLYFKYLNFFIDQFSILLESIGLHTNWNTFDIIMPLGISFFTFKLIAYIIEVHRKGMSSCHDFITFGVFIAYFPTIISGPIDNPIHFIPQLKKVRIIEFSVFVEAIKRIVWGLFLKMCIADQLSGYTSAVLGNYEYHNATSIILAAVLYSFQIYSDFSGYSEMAIGVSKILGIKVMENFKRPYLASTITEFWKRWHISLTKWLTQYIYIYILGGNRCTKLRMYNNILITFIVSGIWHGANWTFLLWGILHGIGQIFEKALGIDPKGNYFGILENSNIKRIIRILTTFILITFNWTLFQAFSVKDFIGTLSALTTHGFGLPYTSESLSLFTFGFLSIMILCFKDIKDELGININFLHSKNKIISMLSIVLLIIYIFYTGQLDGGQFLYFQF